ncbi:MAG TPA: hypothetical protein VKX16_11455 [Chloroflexota bacterium]|nr:hypothetical protein [Chloroflexota bacterium]
MDTREARTQMRDMAREGLAIVEGLVDREGRSYESVARLRQLAADARSVLPDAGFPAEGAWRALQQAVAALTMGPEEFDQPYWVALAEDLRAAIATLDGLLTHPSASGTDFHIVG